MLCWHRWTVVEKTEQPSPAEVYTSTGSRIRSLEGSCVLAMLKKPVIVTYRCAKCGAEKVERI